MFCLPIEKVYISLWGTKMTRFSKQDDESKICITKGGDEKQL